LLKELLQQTEANIYCLVRASDIKKGKKRLQKNLETYLLWDETLDSRIFPVLGDLSQPFLGLSRQVFDHLANQINVIYHNGASVNFIYPYSKLKAINVLGTQEVLRLASCNEVKPVHFVSTLSVFLSPKYSGLEVVLALFYVRGTHQVYLPSGNDYRRQPNRSVQYRGFFLQMA